jgi:thioesterase domain-containing protein
VLQTIRSTGAKPPFFMVHGLHGVMPLGAKMGDALDPDRPLFALHARGIDGVEAPDERMEDMLGGCLSQIRAARPHGPYVLGGVCAGGLIALELARALTAQGERVGTVIAVDPPLVPYYQVPINRALDPKSPGIYRQLHTSVEEALRAIARDFRGLPFDVNDAAQFEKAIETGIGLMVMLGRYVPPSFDGRTEFIICSERAHGHFHPESPWRGIVPRPGRVHVLPGHHKRLFFEHLPVVLRLMQFALDAALDD